MGKNGKAGKGGEQGKNYIGVLKVIKTFGIINKPENLEQNHDNTGEGIMGNSVTTVVGTAGGAFGAGVGRFCLAEVATQTINVGSRFGVKVCTNLLKFYLGCGRRLCGWNYMGNSCLGFSWYCCNLRSFFNRSNIIG